MRYEDALAEAIEAVRSGQTPSRIAAHYPEHEQRLLQDVELTAAVQAYSRRSSASENAATRARTRLNSELVTLRSERSAPKPRGFLAIRGLAFAAVVALAVVGSLALGSGIFNGATSAEAVTFDGVVVETGDASLLVQTESGFESISLSDRSAVIDERGALISASNIDIGRVVVVEGTLRDGSLRVERVESRGDGALNDWCSKNPMRCQEVEPRLRNVACQASPDACRPGEPFGPGSGGPERGRLPDLARRCQQAGGDVCEQLRVHCRDNAPACAALTGWLHSLLDLPSDLRERIRLHAQRCQAGSILDCRELRLLCEQESGACPAPRPTGLPTPARERQFAPLPRS